MNDTTHIAINPSSHLRPMDGGWSNDQTSHRTNSNSGRDGHLDRQSSPRNERLKLDREYDFKQWLGRAEELAEVISGCEDPPYQLMLNARRLPAYRLSRMGYAISNLCKGYKEEVVEHYRSHRFNPCLTVMLKAVAQYQPQLQKCSSHNGHPLPSDPRTFEILGAFVDAVRSACRSHEYKAEMDNYQRNEEKNIASCCRYMAAQFERRSQLLILRVDLYIRPLFYDWGYTRAAGASYSRFLRALRECKVIDDVLGYVSKREDGPDRGIHYHMLIIVDGHKHRDGANLSRMVGEAWVAHCGSGSFEVDFDSSQGGEVDRASYFNCYTRRKFYRYDGLGLARPGDVEKLRGIREAIEYMCKETSQLKPNVPKGSEGDQGALSKAGAGSRNLRRGIMPKGHSGRGAPRTSGLDTSVIERELLKK